METPARFTFTPNGSTKTFPIPTTIKGDNYVRIDVDSKTINDRNRYDIVNNAIVFVNVGDVPSGSQLDVLVVQTDEGITNLGAVISVDTVAQNIASVNTVATSIGSVNTVAANIASVVNTSANMAEVIAISGSIGNINAVGNNTANINILSVPSTVSNIATVAANVANVNTVGTDIASVNTVAPSIASVVTAAANIGDIDTVAGSIGNVNKVGTDISSVNTVAPSIGSVVTTATNITDVNTVAGSIGNVDNVGSNITSVTTVAGSIANVNNVSANIANINAVGPSIANVNAVAPALPAVNIVAGDISAVVAVALDEANINIVAGSINSVNTAATNIAGINTAAANLAAIQAAPASAAAALQSEINSAGHELVAGIHATNAGNSAVAAASSETNAAASAASAAAALDNFDDRYLGVKATDPTLDNDGNALVQGSLYFNSATKKMMVYDGSTWLESSSVAPVSMINYVYTAGASQTTYTGADNNAAVLTYTIDNVIVSVDGVVATSGTDYTANDGTSIVLSSAPSAGATVKIVAFKSFTTADIVSATNGGIFAGDVTVPQLIATTVTSGQIVSNGAVIATGIGSFGDEVDIDGDLLVGTNALVVDTANNRVGVNKTTPAVTLDVGGDVAASIVYANTVDLGDWTITEASGVLYFATGGVNKMKIDASGNLTVTGNVTAYGSI